MQTRGTGCLLLCILQFQQKEHHDVLLKKNEELKQKINDIKAERAQQEPEVLKVIETSYR